MIEFKRIEQESFCQSTLLQPLKGEMWLLFYETYPYMLALQRNWKLRYLKVTTTENLAVANRIDIMTGLNLKK